MHMLFDEHNSMELSNLDFPSNKPLAEPRMQQGCSDGKNKQTGRFNLPRGGFILEAGQTSINSTHIPRNLNCSGYLTRTSQDGVNV